VFVTHGAGEHCQKYERLANVLTDKGLFVFSHDHGEKVF
jgi:acylglycerol lipase